MRARSLLLLVLSAASCRNTVGDEGDVDAGLIAPAEGEGEGEGGEGEGEGECPPDPVNGIELFVEDDVTRFPICNATVEIVEGAFRETLAARGVDPDCDYAGAEDRPGAYVVTVSAATYQSRSLDVEVDADACGHAVLRRVEIRLPPE